MKKTKIDTRIEEALKQDAAELGALSKEVPPSLRTLISSTPAATTTPFIASSSATAAKILTTKLALWSAGGMLVVATGYFALATEDKTPINPQPEPTLTPMAIAVDSPKPAPDTSVVARQSVSPKSVAPPSKAYTQAEIDSMLRALPAPAGTLREADSVRGRIERR